MALAPGPGPGAGTEPTPCLLRRMYVCIVCKQPAPGTTVNLVTTEGLPWNIRQSSEDGPPGDVLASRLASLAGT